MTEPSHAVFLSYASQDAHAAQKICEALRAGGIEVWFDQSELRGGDAWDHKIRDQIHDCRLFIPVISANTENRDEGYFRREWRLAVERVGDMVHKRAFLVPVVIDGTPERGSAVPEKFHELQWTRLPGGETPPEFVARIARLLSHEPSTVSRLTEAVSGAKPVRVSPGGPLKRAIPITISVLAAAALAYWLVDKFWLSKRAAGQQTIVVANGAPATAPVVPAVVEKSIAVLPFADLSEKKDQEYFADGMTEEIIDLLTKVPDLRVPARTSSFYFRGKSTKVSDIARELGVAHILEGSIRRAGNRIRVSAQLVRADNGYDLWSQTYDRDLHDIFKVQDDIANAVVQALQITLMGGPLTREKGGTQNLEAYLLYLRSDKENAAYSAITLKEARKHAEQAIKLDPDFLLARNMLGWININLSQFRELPVRDAYERARQQGQRALELSPDLADAHLLLGYIHRTYDWDWAAAQSEARQGLKLDPAHRYALELNGQVAASIGDWDAAEQYLRRALANDPLNPQPHWDLGTTLYRAGRFAAAETEYRKLIELVPDFGFARSYLAKTLLAEGKSEAALAMAQQEGDEAMRLDILPIVLQAAGHRAEADEALTALATKYADTDAYFVAMNYAYRDDHDHALQWLERAYQQQDVGFVEIVGEPLFKNLANDARYKAFLQKMNLPQVVHPGAS